MSALIDLQGQRFGKLLVLEKGPTKNKKVYWVCQCDCGTIVEVRGDSLTKINGTKSCGCLIKEVPRKKRKINLIGQRFGRLVVIEEDFSKNRVAWKCKCDCGNFTVVTSDSLREGRTKSCGCLQKEAMHNRKQNLVGLKFGRLTVIEEDNQQGKWKCKCDCGNITYVSASNLKSGAIKSCGCLWAEKVKQPRNKPSPNRKEMVGKRFGKLVVLSLKEGSKSHLIYNCLCDCGRYCEAEGVRLREGKKNSCGHCNLTSVGEYKITNILTNLSIKFEREKTFPDLKNPKTNGYLRFDFFLPEKNIIIEYDGEQHFKEVAIFKDSLNDVQYRDQLKADWCLKHSIHLIRIPYYDLNKINEQYILNSIR